mmetsp:Transcript_33469/g.67554  ORF Transcript_33469/g.67554 Transcript_33469/m.67554 type:complete len:505 (-) Transcript_33469:336-1850(-)
MSPPPIPRDQPVIVFSASFTSFLAKDESRLPPTHVGVRRVRPSHQAVKDALKRNVPLPTTDALPSDDQDKDAKKSKGADMTARSRFSEMEMLHPMNARFTTTGEDGVERRMTKQEKKVFKSELKRKRAEVYKELKKEQKGCSSSPAVDAVSAPGQEAVLPSSAGSSSAASSINTTNKRQYHELTLSQTAIEEELAELRGSSNRVPPVVLSAPMANEALRRGILNTTEDCVEASAPDSEFEADVSNIDDSLSTLWANTIHDAMRVAEAVRGSEDMRPMAYKIVPEVWDRQRPADFAVPTEVEDDKATKKNDERSFSALTPYDAVTSSLDKGEQERWSFIETRPVVPEFDDDISVIYRLLYRQTNLHISCGSKFGCDFLLYDGSREDRHAFAGLRVCSNTSADGASLYATEQVMDSDTSTFVSLPLPNSYDLAGYVRCLNTAGKLALLATVVRVERKGRMVPRVAIVDLALEKILSAPTHQKKKRSGRKLQQIRKEGGENLDKKRG